MFALAFIVTLVMARRVRVMDVPNSRSAHTRPVPKSGGVAIVLTFAIASLIIYFVADYARIEGRYFWGFLLCGVLLAVVSLIDDVTQTSFIAKVIAQMVCAFIVVMVGLTVTEVHLPFLGKVSLGWFGYVITFLWVLGLTNAYNFMDGLDGLAAGVAVIAAIFLCGIAITENSAFVYMTSYALMASVAGFLVFNFPPARIFMGDVGSAFIGFTFATLAVIGANLDRGHLSFYVVPLLLFQFIFDTALTFALRLTRREKFYLAHRTHLYQLLNRMGYSHRAVSLFHYSVAVAQGIGACVLVGIAPQHRLWVFLPFLLFNIGYARWTLSRAKTMGLI